LPAMGRAAALNHGTSVKTDKPHTPLGYRCAADRQPAGLLRPSARSDTACSASRASLAPTNLCALRCRFWPEAVGAWLAGDGVRSSPDSVTPAVPHTPLCYRCAADRQQAGLLRPSARSDTACSASRASLAPTNLCALRCRFWPEAVGAWLAGDGCAAALTHAPRLRQISRIRHLATASRQIVSKLDSYGLRPEAKATGDAAQWSFCAHPLLAGGRRSLACRRWGAQQP